MSLRHTALLALLISGCSEAEREFNRLSARTQKNCGDVTLARGCTPGVAEASACFNAELQEGRPATLKWTSFTIEGDPISNSVFNDGPSAVTLIIDNRADAYGDRKLHLKHCSGLTVDTDGFGCPTLAPVECAAE